MFIPRLFKDIKLLCILGLTTAVLASGCNKLVEIDRPKNTISTEKTFENDANANGALAGMYTWMMDAEGDVPSFSNGGLTVYAAMLSDELENIEGTANPEDYEFNSNNIKPSNSIVLSVLWNKAYKVIYSANAILEGVASSTSIYLTDSARKQLTAEAKLGRAFAHFYLVNLFGDVPMMLTTDITKTATLERTPSATVYKQIEQDLKDAFLGLRDDYSVSGNEKVRPNKWAAAAMLARMYLYQQRWAEAEAQASLVIGSGKFHTKAPADIFQPNSDEAIWQLKHENSARAGEKLQEAKYLVPEYRFNQLPDDYKILFMDPSFYQEIFPFLTPRYLVRQSLQDAFEPDDLRKTNWIDFNPTPAAEPWNGRSYWYPVKYKGFNADLVTPSHGYYTVLRISEQYLIRAEARAQQGTDLTGAASDLNEIRNKSGLNNTTAAAKNELLDAVMQERKVELFVEWGHRWFDLKRTNRAQAELGTIAYKQPWDNNRLLLPIPASEIQKNPRLKPNPGY